MELPYDGDTENPEQYCVHGTFIGSWWGPDYLCQWCEDGISVAEAASIMAGTRLRAQVENVSRCARVYGVCITSMREAHLPYDAKVATNLVNWILDFGNVVHDYEAVVAAGREDECLKD